jgi:putative endonuclease
MPDAASATAQPVAELSSIKPWFVYLVRAANGSLYCGISDNPVRRFASHQNGKGARFFSSSPAVALVYIESWPSKGEALRHERLIKRLKKSAKEHLVASFDPMTIQPLDKAPSA